MIIWKEFTFDSAHYLPQVPAGHKCGRMHGHTFKVRIEVFGQADPLTGWVMDFSDISGQVKPLIDMLDHSVLNDFAGLENPTSERIAMWFWEKLVGKIKLRAVQVQETCTSGARLEK